MLLLFLHLPEQCITKYVKTLFNSLQLDSQSEYSEQENKPAGLWLL